MATTVTPVNIRGRFLWYELMTTDPKAAQDFYTKVIGWGLQPLSSPGGEPYVMWTRGETAIGGLMRLPDDAVKHGAPPHWAAYVGTPDVDATYKQAVGLGARTYVPPSDIPTLGRFAVIADPQGAVIAIFQPQGPPAGPEKAIADGDIGWVELTTTDLAAAVKFYETIFGWEKTGTHDMGPMGTYHLYGREGRTLGGMWQKPPDMPIPPHWLLYVRVPDIEAATERVKTFGGVVMQGPMDVPGGDRISQCKDPQGAAFALVEMKASERG